MRPVIPGAPSVPRAKPINIAELSVAVVNVAVATLQEVVLVVVITREVNVVVAIAREDASVSEASVLAVTCLPYIPVAIRVARTADVTMDTAAPADLVAKAWDFMAALDTGRVASP